MKVVLYCPLGDDLEKSLLDQILRVVRRKDIIVCRTLQELAGGVLRPSYEILAAVIHTILHDELKRLEELRGHMRDIRVILVLPDSREETYSAGFRLVPRFVCGEPDDIYMIAPVLEKMRTHTVGRKHSG